MLSKSAVCPARGFPRVRHAKVILVAAPSTKSTECYLGLLYAMDDVAVYGYVTPLKVKLVVALALSDSVVRDADVTLVRSPHTLCVYLAPLSRNLQIFRALHMAYYHSLANPFLKLDAPQDATTDHSALLEQGGRKWKGFRRRVDDIGRAVGAIVPVSDDQS